MHTTTIGPRHLDHWIVHHNGDFSGDVHIQRMNPSGSPAVEPKPNGDPVTVPFAVLESLVANKVRNRLIERLENAGSQELLLRGIKL